MLRLARRILLPIAAALVAVALLLVAAAYFFQDEVKARLVAELNTHLTAPLHQNGIELTLIQRFPQASLRIRDAFMREVRTDGGEADTLLYAKDLYLEFSLFALFTGNYTVHDLHGTDVRLRPGLDANGSINWEVWKADTAGRPGGGGTAINLRKVTFDGLDARFHDHRTGLLVAATSEQLTLGARFRPERSTATVRGDVHLAQWREGPKLLLSDRQARVDLAMAFGDGTGAFRLDKGELLFGKTPVNLTVALAPGPKGQQLDLRANAFGMKLADLVQLLPDPLRRALGRYGMDGLADLAVHYAGDLDQAGPSLSVGMKLRDGRFKERASGTVFRNVNGEFSAEFTPAWATRKLVVKQFSASSPSGPIGGNLEVVGERNAKLSADIHANLDLADLQHFIGLDTLEQVAGSVKAQARVQGRLRDVADLRAADLRALSIQGQVALKDVGLKMKGLRHRVTGLNAELALNGNDAQVRNLRCQLQGNELELAGTLRNLVPYLIFKDQHLAIDATGHSPSIDLASLLETREPGAPASSAAYAFTLPALIDLDLRASIGELHMADFRAADITCQLHMAGRQLALKSMRFRTAEGSVSGSLALDARPAPAYPLAINAELKGIDVTALFGEFRNFGQGFITAAQVKGKGDASLTFTAPLRPDFSLDQDRLHCLADITLANGELNDHPALMEVADHLRRNKLTSPFVDTDALKRQLRHVTFAKLENRIEIKDRAVYLPQMNVSCSVMDLEVSGTHGFDGAVDDHLSFRLGDLFRAGESNGDEFGPIVDDGTGLRIFLHMYGTTDNLQFGNDGAMAAARRKERMRQETAQLKGILKGIVAGEHATAAPAPPQGQVTVDFGGDNKAAPPLAPKPKTGLGRLLQKNDKETPPVVIGVE